MKRQRCKTHDRAKRSSGTFSSSGSTFGFISRQRSANGDAVLGTWRGLALLWQRGGSAGIESRAPLSATIATLCELQWDPQGPVLWTTLDGAQFSLVADGAAADPRYLRREFSAAIDQQLWARAARHEPGKGSQQGVDWHATRLHLARLRKRGQHKEAIFLMACLTGALWPLQRQHECPRSGETPLDPTCLRCEEGCAETFLYRHWLCAGNLFDHPNEAAKQAHQRLSRRAQTEAADTPCLRFRGLLPASHTTGLLPPTASEAAAMVFGAGGASTPGYLIRNHPLYWYTDGSGGKSGHDARLVRAGWSAVGVSCKVPFPQRAAAWGALCGPLPGELQGSDSAEIWALFQLLERTLGDLVIGTDCDYLVKRFHRRWWAREGCFKNGDLWCRIGAALNRKRKVVVYKVRAHVLAPDSPLDPAAHTWTSVVGNELADAFAEKGTLLHEVPVDVVAAVSEADSLAFRIQKWLYTTARQAVPELKGSAKSPDSREARKLTLPRLMAATARDLLRDPLKLKGQWHWCRCGHTIAHKHLRERRMNVPCVPLLHTAVPDLFHAGQLALIGLQATHGSLKWAYKRGIWWCVACGSWASSAARNLSRPCTGQPTKGAQDVLARLDKGLTPQPHVQWQSPQFSGASMRFGVWDPLGKLGRRPKDRAAAVRGHPHENPGRRPKNRAGVVVAGCCSCDCFGGTTHRGGVSSDSHPFVKDSSIIIIIIIIIIILVCRCRRRLLQSAA